MIKSSSDNYSKSFAECLVIILCLYIAITFHNNLTEAKIANELITLGQALDIVYLNLLNCCLISWPTRLVILWVQQTFHVRFPVLVSHAK